MRETDQYTSPLDDLDEESDYKFELPPADAGRVVIVDDEEDAATLNRSILEAAGYVVQVFHRPADVLAHLDGDTPTVLLTDNAMPEMSGLELAQKAMEADPTLRVILMTGTGDEETAQSALRMGVSDYIIKPPEPVSLARSVQKAFHERAGEEHHRAMVAWMKLELDRRAKAIREVTVSALAALANALDMRNPHFHGHSRAVALQAAAIAEAMGMDDDQIEAVRIAGLLHDVGMMAIPDALVEKDSALTEQEFDVIRTHCERGAEILRPMKHLGEAIRYVAEHHERVNGSGYPEGKKGDEISLGGQIVGIAEAWIAILESRAYRSGMSREEGLKMLQELSGQWFSPEVTNALREADLGVV